MTEELKRKIGKLFMLGVPGEYLTEDYTVFCEKYYFGNYCISAANAVTVDVLYNMTKELRRLAYRLQGEYPFVAIDQEGGRVTRFYEGAGMILDPMAYSAMGADSLTMENVGRRLGRVLRSLGCNINNAPVLDVNIDPMNPIIGTRSYSDRPEKVAELGVGFLRGLEAEGVISAVKHFPGHGNVSADTHIGGAVNHTDAATLRKTELSTFQKAFEAGTGALMSAHVTYPAFSNTPATVSKTIITDLLRKEMGFDGVVITDSLMMHALSRDYLNGEEAVAAIEAGCDQLLYYPFHKENVEAAINAVYAAVESGHITEERINQSCERIERQKKKYGIDTAEPNIELAYKLVYDQETIAANFQDALSGITCIENDGILGKLANKKILCIAPVCDALQGVEEARRQTLSFSDVFSNAFSNSVSCVSSLDGLTPGVKKAIDGEYDVVVIGVFHAAMKPRQMEIVQAAMEKGKPIIAVLLKTPYDARYVKNCNAIITCYGYTPLSVKATVAAMKNNDYRGKLPIALDV